MVRPRSSCAPARPRFLRPLALLGVAAAALSGCASGGTDSAPAASSPAASTASPSTASPSASSSSATATASASSASPSASAGGSSTGTQVVAFNPWNADGTLRSDWTSQGTSDATCTDDPSPYGVGDNTYDCGGEAFMNSACATSPTSQTEVACLVDPWKKTVGRFRATSFGSGSALAANSTARGKDPEAFETTDGRKFQVRMGGTVGQGSADHIARYWCVAGCDGQKNVAAFAWSGTQTVEHQSTTTYEPVVNRDGATWRAKVQVYEQAGYHPETVGIAKAWFVTGSRDQAGQGSGTRASAASSCANGPSLPSGVTACGSGDGATEATGSAAVVQSPSGNIMCSLTSDTVDCTMNDPRARIDLDTSSAAADSTRDDGPPEATTQTLDYGQSLRLGSFVCSSSSSGMACWNTNSQHGMFLSKQQTEKW